VLGAGDAAAWQGHGIALARLNHHDQALASLSESLRLDPANALTLYNRANILAGKNRYEEAARDLEALLSFDPEFPLAVGALLNTRLHVCDWREFDRHCEAIIGAIRAGKRLIHPFANLLISDSPADQLLCARLQTDEACPSAPQPIYRGERYRHDKIRIAYLSGDFYQHAVPFLIAGVLECHDRSRFEISGISFGGNDSSEMRDRLETACERFLDVPDKSDREIAQLVRELEIDIAIDLKGHTGGARPGIFAHRPAPIQVNYLGYPGTMGAPYMDYLLADRTLIPDGEQRFYAEQIVYLPYSYQANDSRRRISTDITRADAGLPQGAFVFCCFNGNQKILPQTFAAWMRILANSEGSVLWLLQDHASAANNLRREAQQRGVSAHRLIFAQHEPHERHLARLKLADLVLDTLPYGAHTTASDALRAGTPVLTRMGKSFAGRVAASLLTAVGHPELITHSEAEYEALACELAQNRSRLAEIKARLLHNRDVMPLFDTARMTRNLETANLTMWQRHERGEQAAGFAVT
jgi:predicted O-linked N-acetylglucosamine transferase (SPINDLY family)